jgi:hypothetical protein
MSENLMSIADFLCYVRQQLIEATLYSGDATYTAIIEDLIYAIQHTEIAEFKVTIPSEDDIRQAGQKHTME